jgi:hypothetical protein
MEMSEEGMTHMSGGSLDRADQALQHTYNHRKREAREVVALIQNTNNHGKGLVDLVWRNAKNGFTDCMEEKARVFHYMGRRGQFSGMAKEAHIHSTVQGSLQSTESCIIRWAMDQAVVAVSLAEDGWNAVSTN